VTTTQAIPPVNAFAVQPVAVITDAGAYVTQGPIPEIYPGPLLPNLQGRSISEAGRAAILAEATRLGLLNGATEFTDGRMVPGGMTGHIDLTVDGQPVSLTGDPTAMIVCIQAPCDPPPGTAAAFADLFSKLQSPESWLGPELGPQTAFVPDAYALLLGPAPVPDAGIAPQAPSVWPLDALPGTFGRPVGDGSYRCGIATGEDAARLRPAFEAANQLTQWVATPTTSATFGITVRPVVGGEDPCAETFGPG
jgi:hypothetical protein